MNVAVFGLGKLGQPMAVSLARAGHQVWGFDTNPEVCSEVGKLRATVNEPMVAEEMTLCKGNLFTSPHVEECVENSEVGYVIVPTPSDQDGSFTNKYVLEAVGHIGEALRDKSGHYTLVVCSTVMPGSVDGEILSTLLAASGRTTSDSDGVSLVYSPQFIALGSVLHDMRNPDLFLIGTHQALGHSIVRNIAESVHEREDVYFAWLKPSEAEVVKLGINTFITNKISFANAIGLACATVPDIDGYAVARTIGRDSRIGNSYIIPGGPYAGPCFPRDTHAFRNFVGEALGYLAFATDRINDHLVSSVVGAAVREARSPDRTKDASILLLGLGYKPASPVTEESFGIRVRDQIRLRHATGLGLPFDVYVHDDFIDDDIPNRIQDPMAFAESPDVVTILCTPEPSYAQLHYSTVIDVWGIIPDANADILVNFRNGNGNYLLSPR